MTGRALLFRPFLMASLPSDEARAAAIQRKPKTTQRSLEGPPLDPDEAARFRVVVLAHLDEAYAFARHLCRDATLAEDIVQDACLRALRAFRGYRDGSAKAWLFAIVRSTFLTHARSRKGAREIADDEALDQAADEGATPEGLVLREAADAAVRDAVDALPDPFREAIVLRELQDMSYREISDITGVPIGTVMSRLARARRMLAVSLAPEASR
jgi:RNA polymerase sigma-70 factor (ECF subfamily)